MNIALFDFDGTITTTDMYSKFLHFSGSKPRSIIAKLVLAPFFILYKIGLLPSTNMRRLASYTAFVGRRIDELNVLGKRYADEVIPQFIREEARNKLDWHVKYGDKVVIVSASLDIYLRFWCAQQGFDLLCSEMEVRGDRYTGFYLHGDCTGANKAKFVLGKYDLSDYQRVYAYGDTKEDMEMLKLADEAYLEWQSYTSI